MSNHYLKYQAECNNSLLGDTLEECGASLWAPSVDRHFVEDRAFSCFAMECEGEQPTCSEEIERIICEIVEAAQAGDEVDDLYVDIETDNLTTAEINYIIEEVKRRL